MYIPSRGCGRHKTTKKDCGDCNTFRAQRELSKRQKVPARRKIKIDLAHMFPRIMAGA